MNRYFAKNIVDVHMVYTKKDNIQIVVIFIATRAAYQKTAVGWAVVPQLEVSTRDVVHIYSLFVSSTTSVLALTLCCDDLIVIAGRHERSESLLPLNEEILIMKP
jgi:hypothetical protein